MVVERLFYEHFHIRQADYQKNKEPRAVQSLDDLEATYRTKGTQHYKGYVANVTETCDPENELQLITKIQVASNNVADSHLLQEALPNLKQRTQLATLHTDGAYPSPVNDEELPKQGIQLIQTGMRGNKPDPQRFNLTDFHFEQDPQAIHLRYLSERTSCLGYPWQDLRLVCTLSSGGLFALSFPTQPTLPCPTATARSTLLH
jgi:hypothetical protein